MKKKVKELSKEEYIETLDILYTAASSVRGRDKMKLFLRDLLTPSERIMLGRRIWIARLLLSGYSQAEIGERLGVGPNTIWRVQRWLGDQMPGYEQALQGLEKELHARTERKTAAEAPLSFAVLKRRYPMHFLLFPEVKLKKPKKKK